MSLHRSRIEQSSRPRPALVALLANPGASPMQRLVACSHLIEMGCLDQAADALVSLVAISETAEPATRLLATCRRLMIQAPDVGNGTTVMGQTTAAGWWAVPAGADVTVIAFAGKARKVGISVYFMQRIFARFGCNMIYLFDHQDAYYLQGVEGLGPNAGAAVAALRPVIDGLGGRTLFCIGQSTGGYGAIWYGSALGADGVLAFSPLIRSLMSRRRRTALSEQIGWPLTLEDVDLRARRLAEKRAARLHIVCGALNAYDLAAAVTLSDLPGVTVSPVPGLREHGSLQASVLAGTFVETVETFMSEVRGTASALGA